MLVSDNVGACNLLSDESFESLVLAEKRLASILTGECGRDRADLDPSAMSAVMTFKDLRMCKFLASKARVNGGYLM